MRCDIDHISSKELLAEVERVKSLGFDHILLVTGKANITVEMII